MDPMDAIRDTFFQECQELLEELECGLLAIQSGQDDTETLHAVFRAVHSVKGGAGAFGLEPLVRFAHVFETALDAVRAGRLDLDADRIALMLRASDMLADHLTQARGGPEVDAPHAEALVEALRQCDPDGGDVEPGAPAPVFTPVTLDLCLGETPAPTMPTAWTVVFRPLPELYRKANDALRLVRELERLGQAEIRLDTTALPNLDHLDVHDPALTWTIRLTPQAAPLHEADIRGVFEFVEGDCELAITPDAPPDPEPDDVAALLARLQAETPESEPAPLSAPLAPSTPETAQSASAPTTIRVELDRVDRLINLVGELVINQAMLAQRVSEADLTRSSTVALGLDDLEQLTREIQDSVMAIRAQPVKSVFQRMPRLVREVAAATGKSVRLVTEGEATEVDKTVIERLAEPITHMIRNAIDHGLETPERRQASGKPAEGLVRLSAQHRSGRIVIEVADDGAGIDRDRVRAIAIERGVIAPDTALTDDEVDNLIFAPGFSTAAEVSDISGRGVGMDVVKRSIQALGGRIVISSRPGLGSTFTLSLPLTLAVLDGMVVSVGPQTLVVPISVIVETLKPRMDDLRPLGRDGTVLRARDRHVPVIDVAAILGWPERGDTPSPTAAMGGVTLLVESESGGLAALCVDAIQGQRQVVIKSLEQNYRQVEGVAAATILGDGRVALILDVDGLIAVRRRHAASITPTPVPA